MTQFKTTIYFWRNHKGSLHLQSVEVVKDDHDEFNSAMIVTLNKIHDDPEKISFEGGLLKVMSDARHVIPDGEPQRPRGATADDGNDPVCPTHGQNMKISKYPTKNADITYYCPEHDYSGYCLERCDVTGQGRRHYRAKPKR